MRKGVLFGVIVGLAPIAVADIRLEVASDRSDAVYGEFYRRLAEWRTSPAVSARFISVPGGLTCEACEVEAQRATEAKSDICPAWGERIVYRKGCKR